jgi:hypothetical protein
MPEVVTARTVRAEGPWVPTGWSSRAGAARGSVVGAAWGSVVGATRSDGTALAV